MIQILIKYFSFQVYVPISILLFIMEKIMARIVAENGDIDAIENMQEIEELVNDIEEDNQDLGRLYGYVFKEAQNGNLIPQILLSFGLSLIPIYRWSTFLYSVQSTINSLKN